MTVRAYSACGFLRETRETTRGSAFGVAQRLSRNGFARVQNKDGSMTWFRGGRRIDIRMAGATAMGSVEALRGGRP